MRIYLTSSPINQTISFDYPQLLTGCLHKWLGKNELHDPLSLYGFSWLKGGKRQGNGLAFPDGARWFISAHHPGVIRQLVAGIRQDPQMWDTVAITRILLQETPDFGPQAYFFLESPVLIKRTEAQRIRYYTYLDAEAPALLRETLLRKAQAAGISSRDISIRFDTSYPKAQTKLVRYKQIANRASLCPVILEGDPRLISFAWEAGLGNSTGIGFGALQ